MRSLIVGILLRTIRSATYGAITFDGSVELVDENELSFSRLKVFEMDLASRHTDGVEAEDAIRALPQRNESADSHRVTVAFLGRYWLPQAELRPSGR
jgi:hypothetical protein